MKLPWRRRRFGGETPDDTLRRLLRLNLAARQQRELELADREVTVLHEDGVFGGRFYAAAVTRAEVEFAGVQPDEIPDLRIID